MVDEDTREEWAKYATPNDEWQSAHRKNSITPLTSEDKDKIMEVDDMLTSLSIPTNDLHRILIEVLNGNEEISKAIQEIANMVPGMAGDGSSSDADLEAELEHIQGILESI